MRRRLYGTFGRRRGLFGIRWIGPYDARYVAWTFVLFVVGYVYATISHQTVQPEAHSDAGWTINLYREDTGEIVPLDIEEYLIGVVAAELLPTFHPEAVKAQAVAARTYTLYRYYDEQSRSEIPGAIISSDFRRGQAWMSKEEYWARHGAFAEEGWARIVEAVRETRGQVLVFGGQPIFAAYHSSSGGHTEDSENYWSGALPYLRGVPDPFDAVSPYRNVVESLPASQVFSQLNIEHLFVAGSTPRVEIVDRYASGRVRRIRIGGIEYTGREVREALELRSTLFEVDQVGDQIHFIQQGNGHGVGLSQYGANGMAQQGYTYHEILRYYYSGVQMVNWYEPQRVPYWSDQ